MRQGSYFPDWLLERRRRAEAALTTVVATCYLLGVSTRRMEKLVETLGITRLSKSQISVAGQLAGPGQQNIRLYERKGLLTPDRTAGGELKRLRPRRGQ